MKLRSAIGTSVYIDAFSGRQVVGMLPGDGRALSAEFCITPGGIRFTSAVDLVCQSVIGMQGD